MRIGAAAVLLAALCGLCPPARAAPFVGDVRVAGGLGTVTLGSETPRQWVTRDGGRTFEKLVVGGRRDASATLLPNGLGYARARNERLWRTTDGGRTWRRTGVKDVFDVTATSTSAWALRSRGKRVWLARSEDGGRTWRSRRLRVGGFEGPAVRVAFADAADGVISGLRPGTAGVDGKPFLLVTRDGGRTWTERRVPCAAYSHKAFPDVRWLASGTLWMVCTGPGGAGAETVEVYTSVDGGRTFALRSRAPLPGTGKAVGQTGGPGHYHGFAAVTDRRAFMSFGYGFTATSDGGRVWRMLRHLPRPMDGGVSALSVDGRDRYLALATRGLWKSPDAGAHWYRLKVR